MTIARALLFLLCVPLASACGKGDALAQAKQERLAKLKKVGFSVDKTTGCAVKAVSDGTANIFIELSLTTTLKDFESDLPAAKAAFNEAMSDLGRAWWKDCGGDPNTLSKVYDGSSREDFTGYVGNAAILAGR